MGYITPTSLVNLSLGNRDGVIAKFTTIAEGETWYHPMSTIEHIEIVDASAVHTVGYTVSGNTVTFKVGGGDTTLGATSVFVLGFK
jgi:hypothetical protein